MSFDNHANLAKSTVATAPSPATSGTTLTVTSGATFPAAPFNCTVWDGSDITTAEIIRVTSKGTGANWTIVRAQESTSARTIVVGDVVSCTITAKVITDVENIASSAFNNSSNFAGINGAMTGGSITLNTSGASISLPPYLTTAMRSDAVTVSALSSLTLSDQNTSTTIARLAFTNGNGLTLSLSTAAGGSATLVGSYTVPTVTNSSLTLSDAATSMTLARLAFTNSNGLTLSLSTAAGGSATLVGSYTVPTVTNSSLTLSDAATSMTIARLAFTNSNGLTLSLSTAAGGSATLVGSYTVPNVPAATSWTASDSATSVTVGRLAFTAANGITMSLSTSNNGNHTLRASYTVPTVTNSSLTLSDAATSFIISKLAFTNSNGLTLTLSTGAGGSATLVGSYTVPSVPAATSWTVSDAVTSATVGRLAFTNSNGLTLSLSTSNNGNHTLIGSYTVPTVTNSTLTLSDANTSFTIARLAFTNSNGLTLTLSTGAGGSATLVGSYTVPTVPAATSWTVSDSATSATVGRLAFNNANGVSFGLSTSNNGQQTITASIATTYAGAGFTSTSTAGVNIVGTLNTSGLSIGVPAFLTTAALSSQTLAFSLGGNSATTNSSQISNGGYVLAGGANVTIQQSNNTISISAAAAAAAPVNFSAGTTSQNIGSVHFADSNGVSFGISTGASSQTITATVAQLNIANSQATFNNSTVNLLEGGGAITIATSAGGQSFKFSVPQTSSLVGANGISISTNGSTISVSLIGTTASYWANMQEFQGTTTTMAQSNSFYVLPLTIQQNVSASYLRLLVSFAFTSTTIATSAVNNATGASTAFSETMAFNAVLYSMGTGANSRSLQYVYSNSAGWTWAASVSQASTSNASNQSISQAMTFPIEGGTSSVSTQYSVSTSNGPISTTQWSNLSAQRYLDIPWATSLSAGVYWLALNRISGTVGGKNIDVNATTYGVSNMNLSFGNLNAATNVSNIAPFLGLGAWTTNVANTSSSIALASISATVSFALPFVQLIRQA